MNDNPFAPPSVAEPPAGRGLVFSSEGGEVVTSLAAWMRGLSTIYYAALGFVALAGCSGLLLGGGQAAFMMFIGVALFGVYFACNAMWLRSAASDFERGVMSDDEIPLGQGFRSLRAYLVLSGILSLVMLASSIYRGVQ